MSVVLNLYSLSAAHEGSHEIMRERPIGGDFFPCVDLVASCGEVVCVVGVKWMRPHADAASVEDSDPGGIDGLLEIHSAIDEVDEDLDLTLRLHIGF